MTRLNAVLRRLFRAPVCLYRWNLGWLLGQRFLLLIHIGRRTGLRRNTVLEVMEVMEYRKEGPEAVVMSAFGRNADWLRNIEATPAPEVVIGSQHFVVAHRFLDEEEAIRVITGYERRNWFIAPIIRAILSRLLGWRYDGSEGARRRLAAQLPLITFRPADRSNRSISGGKAPEAA
jgi:deazaflavin-dependent oxidoreductase (nitroreductase family)